MVDDRASPSVGWRGVSREMEADADVEEPVHSCPNCGRQCGNVLRDVYECAEHGVFRASADDGDSVDCDDATDGDNPADADSADGDDVESPDAGETIDSGRDAPDDEATDRTASRAD